MDKAKAATNSFSKQVEDIEKKFTSSFKEIFLSVLGPMALFGTALGFIGKIIADNQRKQEEANQAAIDGTNKLMSAEDIYYQRKRARESKGKEAVEQAKLTREEVTQAFLQNDPRGKEIFERALKSPEMKGQFAKPRIAARIPSVQAEVQAIIAEDIKKNPAAGAELVPDKNAGNFKGPEGFGTVIGVGANPVLEAMTKQVEVLQEIKVILEQSKPGGGVPPPFTERPNVFRNTFNA